MSQKLQSSFFDASDIPGFFYSSENDTRGLSGKYLAILNISKIGRVYLM